jgi:hypothetical protein
MSQRGKTSSSIYSQWQSIGQKASGTVRCKNLAGNYFNTLPHFLMQSAVIGAFDCAAHKNLLHRSKRCETIYSS